MNIKWIKTRPDEYVHIYINLFDKLVSLFCPEKIVAEWYFLKKKTHISGIRWMYFILSCATKMRNQTCKNSKTMIQIHWNEQCLSCELVTIFFFISSLQLALFGKEQNENKQQHERAKKKTHTNNGNPYLCEPARSHQMLSAWSGSSRPGNAIESYKMWVFSH